MSKQAFDVEVAMRRIAEAVRPFPKAALFALAEEGFHTPFAQLVACIISIRTLDEMTGPVARRLLSARPRQPPWQRSRRRRSTTSSTPSLFTRPRRARFMPSPAG